MPGMNYEVSEDMFEYSSGQLCIFCASCAFLRLFLLFSVASQNNRNFWLQLSNQLV